jgi:hypothetical protein
MTRLFTGGTLILPDRLLAGSVLADGRSRPAGGPAG